MTDHERDEVVASLERLKAVGFIKDFSVNGEQIAIEVSENFKRDAPRWLAMMAAMQDPDALQD